MKVNFSTLASQLQGQLLQSGHDESITDLLTDSRKAIISKGSVFIAIKGERHDGHAYIKSLYGMGIRYFIVQDQVHLANDAGIIVVRDTVEALQQLAILQRSNYSKEVVGITGSNGKTIVKEWLYQVLEEDYSVHRSPKSYNSQIGVPLSVWPLDDELHEMAIIEAGISQRGEMQKLARIIKPAIGIFTNIGSAHAEGFASIEEKVQEKATLFADCQVLIYCKDHEHIDAYYEQHDKSGIVSWSLQNSTSASIQFSVISKSKNYTLITVQHPSEDGQIRLNFTDTASVENALHVVSFLILKNYSIMKINEKLQQLHPINMRLMLKQGLYQSFIIDDSYNNDPAGLRIALDFLEHQHQQSSRKLIISDMLQSGKPEKELYKEVSRIVNAYELDELYLIGTSITKFRKLFKARSLIFDSTSEFLRNTEAIRFANSTVLVKGARVFGFEQIVKTLQQKVHGTVLEINLDALTHNLNHYRAKLAAGTKTMVMVKAFAYGTGLNEVAKLLQFHRVDYLGVAYADEGVQLRKSGIKLPIMVMNTSTESFALLIAENLEPVMYSLPLIRSFAQYCTQHDYSASIHIEVNTGMNRLGFDESDLEELIHLLLETPQLRVRTVFSHLAGADEEEHNDFSYQQATRFLAFYNTVQSAFQYKIDRHLLNSPGISRFPEYQFEMVRLGIGLYGIDAGRQEQHLLTPISTLKTTISQVHYIRKGESIGYGRKGVASQAMQVATIAIGYADGFSRAFGNGKGFVTVHGTIAPVVGNVCMDMTMVDITGTDAKTGDEVIVFGEQPSIIDLAKAIDTIPYEILTNVSERVKRIYYME